MNAPQQQLPAKRHSPEEIDLMGVQAGERARLHAQQQNAQAAAKMIDQEPLDDAAIDLIVKHAIEGARLRAEQNNERYDLAQAHEKAGQALMRAQAAEREKLEEET